MKIKLGVKCYYSVSVEFDDVPVNIATQLLEMDDIKEGTDVYDWLTNNVREGDAFDWGFDVWNAERIEGGEK